jgi:acyl-CoA reductase-like NAD-dependent aldehyde dehydrogenase
MTAQLRAVAGSAVRHESMRIAGKEVDADDVIEVFNPYDNSVVGTVPKGTKAHAAQAFEIAS